MNFDPKAAYPGIPEPFRGRSLWLINAGILPDYERKLDGRLFHVGQKIRRRAPKFGFPVVHVRGMGDVPLAGRTGQVRGFVQYRDDVAVLVHYDGTPEYDPDLDDCPLNLFWADAASFDIVTDLYQETA